MIQITSEHAAPVVYEFGSSAGYPGSGFVSALLHLLSVADLPNRERLFLAFPEYVLAWDIVRSTHGGTLFMEAVARGEREAVPVDPALGMRAAHAVVMQQAEYEDVDDADATDTEKG